MTLWNRILRIISTQPRGENKLRPKYIGRQAKMTEGGLWGWKAGWGWRPPLANCSNTLQDWNLVLLKCCVTPSHSNTEELDNKQWTGIHTYIHTYAIHIYVHIFMYITKYIYTHTYICIYTRTYLPTYLQTHTYTHTHTHTYIYIYIYIYILLAVLKRLTTPSDFHTLFPPIVPFTHSYISLTHGWIYPIFPGSSVVASFFPSFRFPIKLRHRTSSILGDAFHFLIFAWLCIIDINNIDNQLDATITAP